jgi:hypothetical protein
MDKEFVEMPLDTLSDLRSTFRTSRQRVGLSQAEVAVSLRVTQASISNFELGTNQQPRKATIERIRALVHEWQSRSNVVEFPPSAAKKVVFCCPACHAEVPGPEEGASYCLKCAEPLPIECSCGFRNQGGAVVCGHCFKSLQLKPIWNDRNSLDSNEILRREVSFLFLKLLQRPEVLQEMNEALRKWRDASDSLHSKE